MTTDESGENVELHFVNLFYRKSQAATWRGLKLFGDGVVLAERFYHTPSHLDASISLVVAGWCEDNRDSLVALGNRPDDIDALITELHHRSKQQYHNH